MLSFRGGIRPVMARAAKTGLIALVVLGLAACGFHLRGESKLQTSFSTLALQGLEGHQFRQIMVSRLEKSGVKLVKTAPYTILLLNEDSERRVSAYSTRAKSAGYELKRIVTFKIIGPGQKEADVIATEMLSRRHLLFRQAELVGKLDEESMLWKEMHEELAERIVRKLESIQTDPVLSVPEQANPVAEPAQTEPAA
jgi:LPS-assembly lipoprotein